GHFMAGGDVKLMHQRLAMDRAERYRQILEGIHVLHLPIFAIRRMGKPVIASVEGAAAGFGLGLLAACDLAIAAEPARFAVSGVNLGLFCSTPMVALSRNLPRKPAMELLLTGEFIDATTALRLGLLNQVVPPAELDAATDALAGRIASKSPAAVALGKRLFYRQLEVGLEEAYRLATEAMAANLVTEDARAGIDAFVDKRPMPEWKGR
ncbi:MAG: enoyl-CoA hydratase, partial [Rhodospirillales bacterium]|nr:enoyl-CoA hydratase [Rhodospirillales bacterium]